MRVCFSSFLSVVYIIAFLANAQTAMTSYEPGGYTVIPPSPEVSALMQYVDFPVSRFTGQPDITLPLYTLREGSLELPITISYHGGGVKVDLQPGVVGYGWSLNAGGCISRSVRGLPDEMNEGNSTYGIHGIFALKKPERAAERQLRDTFLDRAFANIYDPAPLDPCASDHILPYLNCSKFNEGRQDMASDIFRFSFLGKTGTFAYNPNDEKPIVSASEAVRLKDSGLPYMGGSCNIEDDMLTRYYETNWLLNSIYTSAWMQTRLSVTKFLAVGDMLMVAVVAICFLTYRQKFNIYTLTLAFCLLVEFILRTFLVTNFIYYLTWLAIFCRYDCGAVYHKVVPEI